MNQPKEQLLDEYVSKAIAELNKGLKANKSKNKIQQLVEKLKKTIDLEKLIRPTTDEFLDKLNGLDIPDNEKQNFSKIYKDKVEEAVKRAFLQA